MPVRYYGQSWYMYQIYIGARVLICKDLRDKSWTEGVGPIAYGMD